jgi:hypothetical protein
VTKARQPGEFEGSSCDPETCDLDEACPFFANCHNIWARHAEGWEAEAMRLRPSASESSLDSSQATP